MNDPGARPHTVPELMAIAYGKPCVGPHRCYYCGAACGQSWPASEFVKESFTGRSGVVAPGSRWICQGCVLCLRESCRIPMLSVGWREDQRMRGYSWVITASSMYAATKADLAELRSACLGSLVPPFAIVLSDSGQTHQLYRGVVNHSGPSITLTLEAERITYAPDRLHAACVIARRICAVGGKRSLSEPMRVNLAVAMMERFHDGLECVVAWETLWSTGLGRLAAWLTPKKEVCEREYA